MRIKAYNLGSVKDVLAAMIEPPSAGHVEAELKLVRRLGALDEDDNLTPLAGSCIVHHCSLNTGQVAAVQLPVPMFRRRPDARRGCLQSVHVHAARRG